MVKYTCLYYSLIQSGLEFRGEGRGRALGVGKFPTLSSRGHGTGELGLCCSPKAARPLPGPSSGASAGGGGGRAGEAGGEPAPVGTPGSGPPGKEGMEEERKEKEKKARCGGR